MAIRWLGRRINSLQEETRWGIIWGTGFLLSALFIAFMLFAAIKLTGTQNAATTASRNATIASNNSAKASKATNTLLTNGKTSSAKSAKAAAKSTAATKVTADEIEKLVIEYHQQGMTTAKEQAAATKELPGLIKQIESAIELEDAASIKTAVAGATSAVEQYFQTHPVHSIPAKS
jgi:hypothetical protein